MPNRVNAAFIFLILLLIGGNITHAIDYGGSLLVSGKIIRSPLLAGLFWLWLSINLLSSFCGLAGSYAALRTGTLQNRYLTVFTVISIMVVKADSFKLQWLPLDVSFTFGFGQLSFGINFLGVLLFFLLDRIRTRETTSATPSSQIATSNDPVN